MNRNDELRELYVKAHSMKHLEYILNHLYNKQSELECTVYDLQISNDKEQADIKKLEGKTFAAFFYGMIGKLDERLTIERAEALAAQAKLESAENELQEIRNTISKHEAELQALSGCDEQYAALLREKRSAIKESANPQAAEILRIEEEIAAAEYRLKEINEALDAGDDANECAKDVLCELNSAEEWGTYDVVGGGLVAGIAKHSHLDNAQKKLWYMRENIEQFRTEISDVEIHADLLVSVDSFSQFADIVFDDIFSDFYMLDQIKNSISQVRHVIAQINDVIRSLRDAKNGLETEIEKLNEEHDNLLVNIDL